MSKGRYVATVDLLVGAKCNRGKIQDEVSSILRKFKIKDITI